LSWRRIIDGTHPWCASIAFITVQRLAVLLNPRAGTQDDAVVQRVRVSLDGEVITLDGPLEFRIRRRALRVIVA